MSEDKYEDCRQANKALRAENEVLKAELKELEKKLASSNSRNFQLAEENKYLDRQCERIKRINREIKYIYDKGPH